jgi:hypothetical protein
VHTGGFLGKPKGKSSLGRCRCRKEDDTEKVLNMVAG